MKHQITIELKPAQILDDVLIKNIAARKAHVNINDISGIEYIKRSLDSRQSKPKYILNLEVYSREPFPKMAEIKSGYRVPGKNAKKVIIVGAGPAGYFAALELLELGIKPVVFERGKDVRSRRFDLREIMQNGIVNPDSNYCFGEGGAGTYSDGKLYTRSNKRGDIKKVLRILVEHGALQDIMIDSHPHIGSNKLHTIISEIRNTILQFGGEVHFDSKVTDLIIKDDKVLGVKINGTDEHSGDAVILATGHSARDIYYLFDEKGIYIERKPFAVGYRIEHLQELINTIQYGKPYDEALPPASYNLAVQTGDRGVFSFCMCPGGLIVPSVTNSRELVVNGMSMSGRNSIYANAGIVTTVSDSDFYLFDKYKALAGLKYQESVESRFYTGDKSNPLTAPAQRLTDFLNKKTSSSLNSSSYIPGLKSMDLSKLLPIDVSDSISRALKAFNSKMKGFITQEANLIGLESRTSSPVRIKRNKEDYSHVQLSNLYPCGEGAGYSGGIVSSAIDGQNAAKSLFEKLK